MEDELLLEEQDRSKLDRIVEQMISNGESEDDIKFVVSDFKSKYGKESSTDPSVEKKNSVDTESPSVDGSLDSQEPEKAFGPQPQDPPKPYIPNDLQDMVPKGDSGIDKYTLTTPQAIQNQEEKQAYWYNKLLTGLSTFNEALTSVPEAMYSAGGFLGNTIAAVADLPEDHWLRTSPEKFKESSGTTNPVLDYYKAETEELAKKTFDYEVDNYKSSIVKNEEGVAQRASAFEAFKAGDIADGFALMGAGTLESAPTSLAIMASGGAFGLPATATGTTVALFEQNKQAIKEQNPDMEEAEVVWRGYLSSAAESVFETLTAGTAGQIYKDILKREGRKAGAETVKKGLTTTLKGLLEKYGALAGSVTEGTQEAVTQITQNMLANKPLMDGVVDAFLIGMGSGAAMTAPINVANTMEGQAIKLNIKAVNNKEINDYLASEIKLYEGYIERESHPESFTPEDVELTKDAFRDKVKKIKNNPIGYLKEKIKDKKARIERWETSQNEEMTEKQRETYIRFDNSDIARYQNYVDHLEKYAQELNSRPIGPQRLEDMTVDDSGNFVFFHKTNEELENIDPSKMGNKGTATSKEEIGDLSKGGSVSFFYTQEEDSETMVRGKNKYAVKVDPQEVYDFNLDPNNYNEQGKALFEEEFPGQGYNPTTQLGYVARLAGEDGFKMVVSAWDGKTRAVGTQVLQPSDVETTQGQAITKGFDQKYNKVAPPKETEPGVTFRGKQWQQEAEQALPEAPYTKEAIIEMMDDKNKDYAFLTAENPNATQVSDKINIKNQNKAIEWLKKKGYNPVQVLGKYGIAENSIFVEDLKVGDALTFAKVFAQESVAHSKGFIKQDGTFQPIKSVATDKRNAQDEYTTFKTEGGELFNVALEYDFDAKPTDVKDISQSEEIVDNAQKPELKMSFPTLTDLRKSDNFDQMLESRENIKKEFKEIKKIIDCLWT